VCGTYTSGGVETCPVTTVCRSHLCRVPLPDGVRLPVALCTCVHGSIEKSCSGSSSRMHPPRPPITDTYHCIVHRVRNHPSVWIPLKIACAVRMCGVPPCLRLCSRMCAAYPPAHADAVSAIMYIGPREVSEWCFFFPADSSGLPQVFTVPGRDTRWTYCTGILQRDVDIDVVWRGRVPQ